MPTEEEIIKNLRKCLCFSKCSRNLCLLDLELHLRSGGEGDKCRWMREPKRVKIKGKEFISGGSVMSDALLISVPKSNLKWLNEISQKRWKELKDKR